MIKKHQQQVLDDDEDEGFFADHGGEASSSDDDEVVEGWRQDEGCMVEHDSSLEMCSSPEKQATDTDTSL